MNTNDLEIVPRSKPKYTPEELLAQCNFDAPLTEEDREWLDAPGVGQELI